jgi:transposase
MHRRCAALDVHSNSVVAWARIAARGKVNRETHRVGVTTRELMELADWLEARGVTHVAMEATGVYWRPVWHMLEGRFTLLLANAAEVRNVPGRDGTFYQDLGANHLVKRDAAKTVARLARRIKDLGYDVHHQAAA